MTNKKLEFVFVGTCAENLMKYPVVSCDGRYIWYDTKDCVECIHHDGLVSDDMKNYKEKYYYMRNFHKMAFVSAEAAQTFFEHVEKYGSVWGLMLKISEEENSFWIVKTERTVLEKRYMGLVHELIKEVDNLCLCKGYKV